MQTVDIVLDRRLTTLPCPPGNHLAFDAPDVSDTWRIVKLFSWSPPMDSWVDFGTATVKPGGSVVDVGVEHGVHLAVVLDF